VVLDGVEDPTTEALDIAELMRFRESPSPAARRAFRLSERRDTGNVLHNVS